MSEISLTPLTLGIIFCVTCAAVVLGGFINKFFLRPSAFDHQNATNSVHTEVSTALANERLQVLERERGILKEQASTLEANLLISQKELGDERNEKNIALTKLEAEQNAHRAASELLERGAQTQESLSRQLSESAQNLAQLQVQLELERSASEEKLALLLRAKEMLAEQFKNLAQDILEEKSKKFSEDNQQRLSQLLDPLKLKITEFQSKVEDVYIKEGKDRSALSEQVKQLMSMNHSLSENAKNLTNALKGSSKTQGNWGELVLERVLEASGLRKGEEYVVQVNQSREDGSRAQADVVIHLPEERSLVVDSKVSLNAYDEFISTEDALIKQQSAKKHIDSVKNHINELSNKNYQALYGVKSLDFVLMFMPIEPAFMMAITHDKDIFMHAWEKNVLLVSPSTLLFVVRTVAHLWRQESQSKNAQEIARRGAALYDKLVGFVEELEALGGKLKQAQISYDGAINKLSGPRSVIRQAQMLKDLGVRPTKHFSPALSSANSDEDTDSQSLVGEQIAIEPKKEPLAHAKIPPSDEA